MALPKIQDLITYVSKVITGADWNTNWQTVVSWLSSGNTDIKVKSIELSASGGITNNGSFAQSGDMNINGNLIVTNDITANKFNGDGSGLTGIVSSATVAYTPFAVNSGNVDTNGLGDILYYTGGSGTLKFKVGGTLPTYDSIIATSAQGVTFTLTQILDLDVSTYDDGTYTVCVKKNQTVAEIKGTLYSQLTTPAGLNNDLWLNTSVEKLKCYEKIAGSWNNEYEGVPVGTFTVASGVITAVTTFAYNYNGYNINRYSFGLLGADLTAGVTKAYSGFTAESDGWVYYEGLSQQPGAIIVYKNSTIVGYVRGILGSGTIEVGNTVYIEKGATCSMESTPGAALTKFIFYPIKGAI